MQQNVITYFFSNADRIEEELKHITKKFGAKVSKDLINGWIGIHFIKQQHVKNYLNYYLMID